MTARHNIKAGYIRGSLDLIDRLEDDVPDESDYYVFFDSTDGRAKKTTPGVSTAPVTPTTATPTALASTDSGRLYTNEGASAQIEFDLPTAVEGLTYSFFVQDADSMKIVANTGDTISIEGAVTDSAGNIVAAGIGCAISIVAINATEWVATRVVGNWFIN